MKTKNGHILTVSHKMQICAVPCFATCDWFCPMTSQITTNYILHAKPLLQKAEKQKSYNVKQANTNSILLLKHKTCVKAHLKFHFSFQMFGDM